jgi:4-amino-4-deoxy-L-arabinose transferase-like glycosyltransferase
MYCHNARNKILFGKWMLDDWNPVLYNSVLTGLYYLGFELFGISIVTVKVTNILLGLLGIVFLYLAIRRYLSESYALVIAFLFALDYYWMMHNRIGLLENFSTLFFILSYFFLVKAKEKPRNMMLVGVCVALAALSKYLFFYLVITSLITILCQVWRQKKWLPLLRFLAGMLIVLGSWFLAIYLPLSSSFRKIGSGWMNLAWPRNIGQMFFNLYRSSLSQYMSLIPLLFMVGLLFVAMVLSRIAKRNPPPDIHELFVLLWLTGTFLQMGILNYQPLRYYLNIVPALFLALSLAIKEREWLRSYAPQMAWVFVPLAAWYGRFWIGLVRSPSAFFTFHSPVVRFLLYIALLLVLLIWLIKSPRLERLGLYYILFALALSSPAVYYSDYFRQPDYRLQTISGSLQQLPPGSILMGQEAPRLALETRFRFFPAYEGWFNDDDIFRRQRPTHLLVLDKFWGGEINWVQRRFPEVASQLKLVRRFPLWDTTVSLYAVVYPAGY